MGFPCSLILFEMLVFLSLFELSLGSRKLNSLVHQPPLLLTYHNGPLLHGPLPINIIWYGHFTPAQRSIITDFLNSLESQPKSSVSSFKNTPTVSSWWKQVQANYLSSQAVINTSVLLETQVFDSSYSMGKMLSRSQIRELSSKAATRDGITFVLTSKDVTVEAFCMSDCGFHESKFMGVVSENWRFVYIWVGNSETECPGQCAWPFHQPIYGPQSPALVAPNGDVGVDGMIINMASLLVGAVTNPYGDGWFYDQGDHQGGTKVALMEAGSACSGIYGKNAYPGYAGELLVDEKKGGGSYNGEGVNGRRYLLPAVWDPKTSKCWTLV